jgi:hypothetical protein
MNTHTIPHAVNPEQSRHRARGAEVIQWAKTQASTPAGQARAAVRYTEQLIGDGPQAWTFTRLRQRVVHRDVLWATFIGVVTWLIVVPAICLGGWALLFVILGAL